MIRECYGDYDIHVVLPEHYVESQKYPAIILNDGDKLEQWESMKGEYLVFGIVPKDRLSEYTPWKEKALRQNTPDFGGQCQLYIQKVVEEIIPLLQRKYGIIEEKLAFGGVSLGGLAAVYSLYQTGKFSYIFSICGSFWYPDFTEFVQSQKIVNDKAKLFLLNGKKEGSNHNNILESAFVRAEEVHEAIGLQVAGCTSIFDEYGHHEAMKQRVEQVKTWLESVMY